MEKAALTILIAVLFTLCSLASQWVIVVPIVSAGDAIRALQPASGRRDRRVRCRPADHVLAKVGDQGARGT